MTIEIENKNFVTKKLSWPDVIETVKEVVSNYEGEELDTNSIEKIAIEIWNELSKLHN